MSAVQITSFYRFRPLEPEFVHRTKSELERLAGADQVMGLCLLGTEGINATLSGREGSLEKIKSWLRENFASDLSFKDSRASKHPFAYFRVKVKDEIVTLGKPGAVPPAVQHHHLSPAEWRLAMQDPNAVILDTRNDYEVEIGKFRGARDFGLKEFNEWPRAVRESGIPKTAPVLMYCTGGIRCEKAILEMHEQGYTNVHQLEGGILNYLEQFPETDFEGECFVFDYRVAVDQHLRPTTKYKLCPHCGQPANRPITCANCGTDAVVCSHCTGAAATACSKNCAYHLKKVPATFFGPRRVRRR